MKHIKKERLFCQQMPNMVSFQGIVNKILANNRRKIHQNKSFYFETCQQNQQDRVFWIQIHSLNAYFEVVSTILIDTLLNQSQYLLLSLLLIINIIIYLQMDFILELLKREECCIQLFPATESQTFQSWTTTNIQQSLSKKRIEGSKKIGMNYGPIRRARTHAHHSKIPTSKSSPLPDLHQNFSKHYSQQCSPKPQVILKLQISSIIKDKQVEKKDKLFEKGVIVRMIKKIQIPQNEVKWVDKDFKKSAEYIARNKRTLKLEWKSIKDVMKANEKIKFTFISNPLTITNVNQGQVGDCYFLSSIAALLNPQLPSRILKVFPQITLNENGFYKARLMFKGILQEVIVDDYLPFYQPQKQSENNVEQEQEEDFVQVLVEGQGKNQLKPLGCQFLKQDKDNNEYYQQLYIMILEKCWAKLCGSYDNIDGGFSSISLHVLSGALTKDYTIEEKTLNKQSQQSFFNKLLKFTMNKYAMCAGTERHTTVKVEVIQSQQIEIKQTIELPAKHIFCVMGVFQSEKKNKKVRIYNPWGFNNVSNSQETVNGSFFISWEQFKDSFEHITVCKIHDNAHYLYSQLNFKPKEFKFIELNIYQIKTGYFAINLSQSFQRNLDYQYLNVNFIVLKCFQGQQFKYITIRSKHQYCDHYLELHDLQVGKYLIAIYISDPQIKESLTFGVYSEDTFGFNQTSFPCNFTNNFLSRVLIKHDKLILTSQEKIYPINNISNGNVWISASIVGNSRIGYIILNVGKNEKKEYTLEFGCLSFQKIGLSVLQPYNTEFFKLTAKPGFASVATIVITNITVYRNSKFKDNRDFFNKIDIGPKDYWDTNY